jgi:hypothetical protein
MSEPSILDARLAEIDRRLRMIQSGLAPVDDVPVDPVAEPPPRAPDSLTPPPPMPDLLEPPPPPPSLIARRLAPPPPPRVARDREGGDREAPRDGEAGREREAWRERDEEIAVLTARLSELTAAHERLLATTQDLLIEQADMLAQAAPAVSVAVGPFTDTPALQAFQRALSGLPQVREVAVREYVGSEGVILDVHLTSPIS